MIDGVEINKINKDDYSRRFQLLALLFERKMNEGIEKEEE